VLQSAILQDRIIFTVVNDHDENNNSSRNQPC